MQQMVLVVDQQKCTGCRQCEMVCSVYHTGAEQSQPLSELKQSVQVRLLEIDGTDEIVIEGEP